MENNPIQQRMYVLLQKWTKAINTPGVKIVRIHAEPDENSMIEDFFLYMLAVDTDQEDLVIVLESALDTIDTYGTALLKELEKEITQWNEADKPEGFAFEQIQWKADYSLIDPKNEAACFVRNINALANQLIPDQKTKMSIVLRMFHATDKEACSWLGKALQAQLAPHVVLGIADDTEWSLYDKLVQEHRKEVYTIIPNLDMDGAVEELAAMANPAEQESPYRIHFLKLMKAVKTRKAKEVQTEAKNCLDLALESLKTNSNWISQIVAVYTLLYNDQLGYKNYEEGIYFASKACEASLYAIGRIEADMAYRLVGQTHLGRGGLYGLTKKWEEAQADFQLAADHYEACNDYLMQCEALRLSGWAYEGNKQSQKELEAYLQAFALSDKINPDTLKASSFPLVAQKLYEHDLRHKQFSDDQMAEILMPLYGADWKKTIKKIGTPMYAEQVAYTA